MKQLGSVICMTLAGIAALTSAFFLTEPYQGIEAIIIFFGMVMGIILLSALSKENKYSYPDLMIFFSLALLNALLVYEINHEIFSFAVGFIAAFAGLMIAFQARIKKKAAPSQKITQQTITQQTQTLSPLTVLPEEKITHPVLLETYNDIPLQGRETKKEEKKEDKEEKKSQVYVVTEEKVADEKKAEKKSKTQRKKKNQKRKNKASARKKSSKNRRRRISKKSKTSQNKKSSKSNNKQIKKSQKIKSSKSFPVIDIEGIGKLYAKKLQKAGIRTTAKLLEAGATRKGRIDLAREAKISKKLILRWVNMADLFRIKGVNEEYSDLLEAAGVDTVPELAQRNPQNLLKKMDKVHQRKNLVRKLPSLKDVKSWTSQAKKMKRVIEY